MLPLRDENPTRGTPFVTILLIAANVLLFLYEVRLGLESAGLERFLDRWAFDYSELAAAIDRRGLVALTAPAVILPLFSHMFLHGGWAHIFGNMLYLWVFGNNIEDRLGSLRYLLFYLTCGVAAAIGQGLVAPGPMVGASGAVAGVLGAYLVLFPAARVSTLVFLGIFITVVQIPAMVVIGFWVVIQLLQGLAELRITAHGAAQVAYWAHLAGFLAGVALLFLLRPRRRYRAW